MTTRAIGLLAAIIAFGALSAKALADHGYWGIIAPHFETFGAAQVLTDLVILAVLACVWMVSDARTRGLNPWPFVALTLAAGSFGPLFYLLRREWQAPVTARTRAA